MMAISHANRTDLKDPAGLDPDQRDPDDPDPDLRDPEGHDLCRKGDVDPEM